MKRMLSVTPSSFFSPGLKEAALEVFIPFVYFGTILLTGFRQPSDSYSRQNWGRPRVPRSLQGPSCPSGEKGASRSNSDLCFVPVNQMFVAFLVVFSVCLGGHSCSFKPFTNCPAYSAYVAS